MSSPASAYCKACPRQGFPSPSLQHLSLVESLDFLFVRRSVGDDDVVLCNPRTSVFLILFLNVLHVVEQQLVVGDNFYVGHFVSWA